jgi:hypothetical protein
VVINKLTVVTFSLLAAVMLATAERVHAQTVLYVDPRNPQSSDSNPGSQTLPVKTITRATALALGYNQSNAATKILIAPGTYRETVNVGPDWRATAASITLEAMTTGQAIVSGSDLWAGWLQQGSSKIYGHAWPYKWGETAEPSSWQSLRALPPLLRRRELIVMNGSALEQVLSYSALKPGSFYVGENEGKIYIFPPAGTDINTAQIEVSTRAKLLLVSGRQNVTIRGLIFKHASTPAEGSAVEISDNSTITLEDNQILLNNWGGLGIYESQNVTARRNVISYNGLVGLQTWRVKNLLAEDNQTSYNNWRGFRAGFYGWATAGAKNALVHGGVFRRHRSLGNSSHGLWFDTDCTDILVTDSFANNNFTEGMFLEAVQGPVTIRNTAICRNVTVGGLLIANAANVTLENNTIYGNGAGSGGLDAQLFFSGEYTGARPIQNWETGQTVLLMTQNWTMRNNTIVGLSANQLVLRTTVSPPVWDTFVQSLTSFWNLWYNSATNAAFLAPNATFMDFETWKASTGRDQTSWFFNPASFNVPINCGS